MNAAYWFLLTLALRHSGSHPFNTAPSLSASPGRRSLASSFSSHTFLRILARNGAERLNGLFFHVSFLFFLTWLKVEAESGCCAQIHISHHCDACLCWYAGHLYMNQKMCYLMKGFASSRLTNIYPTTSLRSAINITQGNLPVKVCKTLF